MALELYIFFFVTIAYGLFIALAVIGFNRLTHKGSLKETNSNHLFFSIVLSARNEEKTIEQCLQQLIKQRFPVQNFEIILIDDSSEDSTFNLATNVLEQSSISFQVFKETAHQGKKKNISKAISLAKGSIIITTDADVVFRFDNWLSTIAHYFETQRPEMLLMPVDFETESGILPTFQIIENIALTAITAGYAGIKKPFMCNGANLAFTKIAYEKAGGYQSHINVSSGEDVFLMEDIKKTHTKTIHYALFKALIVKTKAETQIVSFFNQRIRWAYKVKHNSNLLNLSAGFIIIMANLLMPALLVAIINKSAIIPYLSIFVLVKFVFDFLLLFLASNYLGRLNYVIWIIPFQCMYWLYALIIGICSLIVKPYWKDKKIK